MQVSPAHLIALLRSRGIRVEVEELLRLHEVLRAGSDWTTERIENVIVGILATCPEDPPRIRDAIRELRHVARRASEPPPPPPPPPGPPPFLSRRVVAALVVGGAATAAGTFAWLSRGPKIPAPDPVDEPEPSGTDDAEGGDSAGDAEGGDSAGPAQPEPAKPPEATSSEPAWVAEERAKQAAFRAKEAARRAAESAARLDEIATIDAARTARSVVVPRISPAATSWLRRIGAALLGPAAALGVAAWLGHRAWRRRAREDQRFGGPALEVAPGPSLFWLTPATREWPPLLDIAARESLVWGVGEAQSEEPTRFLDEDATIDATIERGGLPELRYRRRRRLRRVWLWRDQGESGPLTARLCAEVHATLHGYGLAVEVGDFAGLPEQFERDDGRVFTLDALEDERESSSVVLLTDGESLLRQWQWRDAAGRSRRPQIRALLRRLSGWPYLTVVHTGVREGLRGLRGLLEPFGIPCVPIEAFPLAVREREHLARALAGLTPNEPVWMWAALCALYPLPVPEALALALLRELGLSISPLALGQLLGQSTTTAGIQFPPATRARLIERLRRSLGDGSGKLPALMRQALAFWRARTIAGEIDWERDASGRGLHRRLVVALLDVWTDPERAARELSALRKSPYMPEIREELARMRPAAETANEPPQPGAFHVPLDGEKLSPVARTRLHAAGLAGLVGAELGAVRWPGWLRGLAALALLVFAVGVSLLVFDATRALGSGGASRWVLGRPADPTDNRLLAHIAGEWREIGAWPLPQEYRSVETRAEEACKRGPMRSCSARDDESGALPGRIAVLDAAKDSVDAVRFADSLLDRGLVEAVWIGEWPAWMIDRSVRAYSDSSKLGIWVFSLDPAFVPTDSDTQPQAAVSRPPFPAILGGSTGKVVAADFCGAEICAVTEAGGLPRVLRAGATGESTAALGAGHTVLAVNYTTSPDGLAGSYRVVTVNQDHMVVVWDGLTGRQVYGYRANGESIRAMAFNRSGSQFVTAATDKAASIWATNGTAGDAPLVLGHSNDVLAAAFSADGTLLATGSAGNKAFVWDAAQIAAQPQVTLTHPGAVRAVAFTADGSGLVTYADRTNAQIWDWRRESRRAWLTDAGEPASTIVVGPGGRIALAGDQVTRPRIWSADTGAVVATLAVHEGGVAAVQFSADGSRVLTAYARTDTARLWDVATGAELAVFRHGVGPGLVGAGFSGDGKYVYTASGAGTVRVWTADGRPASMRAELPASERTWDRSDSPTGTITIYRSDDWQHLINAFEPSSAEKAVSTEDRVVYAEAPRSPGGRLLTGVPGVVTAATETSAGLLVGTQTGEVYRVSASGEAVRAEAAHARAVTSFTSGAGKILSLAADGTAKLWSADGDVESEPFDANERVVMSKAVLDGSGILSALDRGKYRFTDGKSTTSLSFLSVLTGTQDSAPGLHPLEDLASSSSKEFTAISSGKLWYCERGQTWECRYFQLEPQQVVASAPRGGIFASGSAAHVPLIRANADKPPETASPTESLQFKGPIGWPVALRYAPDGERLAVGSLDGTVWLSRANGDGCPRVLRHEAPLAVIDFSADSSLLATGSFDGDVRVFRAADGAGPVRLAGHRGPVHSVAFIAGEAGGAQRILSVSADGSARVWASPTADAFTGFAAAETRCVDAGAVTADASDPTVEVTPDRNRPPAVCPSAAGDNACEKCVKANCCEALSDCSNKKFKACTTSISQFDACGRAPATCSALYNCTFLGRCGDVCQPNE